MGTNAVGNSARPNAVPVAVLAPGAGLEGGGPSPDFGRTPGELRAALERLERRKDPSDPQLDELERDVRPPDYAGEFAAAATRLVLVDDGAPRPPWWEAVRAAPRAESAPDLGTALRRARGAA